MSVRTIPFPVVDEVARHCLQEEEPETVHIEVHLPGRLDPAGLRKAFHEALLRHPRILMREAPGRWYRRRYEWELTERPDVEVVTFPAPGRDALRNARTRALTTAPPLTDSPPVRLEVVERVGRAEGSEATDAVGTTGTAATATSSSPAATGSPADTPAAAAGSRAGGAARVGAAAPRKRGQATPTPAQPQGTVLFLTINHTALDGPACLRVLATAAEIYSGRDNSPTAPPTRAPEPQPAPTDTPSNWSPPARVAPGTPEPSPGNGLLVTELPLPQRPKGAPYTVNDQLMVSTALTIAHWNREHG
ncbi:MAG: condensation protein, partial [Streptomyces sp.]|nr:condensation protein [Streptomyces sp.]